MESSANGNLPVRNEERANGRASILAIGTAVPPNVIEQATFADHYFKFTNSEHMVDIKKKFARICENSAIKKRHWYATDEIFQENPSITSFSDPSLDARQHLMDIYIPQLATEASLKAIEDWGRPLSDITHVVFSTCGGCKMPGADYELVKRLGLPLSSKRYMFYQIGCYGGGTVLRVAKDLAENNRGARVLAVCCENYSIAIRGPNEKHIENLVGHALFGDGAAALIVGAEPQPRVEKLLFEIVKATQNIIPGSDGAIVGQLRESGLVYWLKPGIPKLIAGISRKLVGEALQSLGIADWNDIFWIVHPGGRVILDEVEKELGLKKEKFEVTRDSLWEYGNLSGVSVLFTMELMRRKSEKKNLATAGEGLEWGVLFGFGPGLTTETVLLRCSFGASFGASFILHRAPKEHSLSSEAWTKAEKHTPLKPFSSSCQILLL